MIDFIIGAQRHWVGYEKIIKIFKIYIFKNTSDILLFFNFGSELSEFVF